MAIKTYKGELGSFGYDDKEYSIIKDESGEYCHYIGQKTKGLVPPVGLTDYTGLYMGTDIEEPVKVAEGVTSTNSMYSDCKHLVKGSFVPDTVRDMSFMYDGCSSLEEIPNFSRNAYNLSAACANCTNLKTLPPIPGSAEICDSIALNAESLTGPITVEEGVKDISCGFAGCQSLTEKVALPESVIKKDDVFANCRNLEDEIEDIEAQASYTEGFVNKYNGGVDLSSSHKTLTDIDKVHMAENIVPTQSDASMDIQQGK